MLQRQSVSRELLELLDAIMKESIFDSFILVGGTALALQLGHRLSIDLDFFGNEEIEVDLFVDKLSHFGKVQVIKKSKNILICSVDGIKVDFVNYRYDWIDSTIIEDNFRLASVKDIAAMKLNAIAGRGSKKDFIDLYYVSQLFSLQQIFEFYRSKYPDGSDFMVLKSLTYFDDADLEGTPKLLTDISWEEIKIAILKLVKSEA